jgi:hypothetical protein
MHTIAQQQTAATLEQQQQQQSRGHTGQAEMDVAKEAQKSTLALCGGRVQGFQKCSGQY